MSVGLDGSMQIRNDRLKTALVDIYHLLQHQKRLQFSRQAYLCVSRQPKQQPLFLYTTFYVAVFVMNMQCDFCEMGTADILEYNLDEFRAFYLVTEHCVS
jgi:hypothetical protein